MARCGRGGIRPLTCRCKFSTDPGDGNGSPDSKANPKDIAPAFNQEFLGTTVDAVTLDDLLDARNWMAVELRTHLDEKARNFPIPFHEPDPDWEALGLSSVDLLPAVRWKLMNLERLRKE